MNIESDLKTVTIRNIPLELHRAIRIRAAQNGRTLQAEMWEILNAAVRPEGRVKLGDLLENIGRKVQLTDEEVAVFDREDTPASVASFD